MINKKKMYQFLLLFFVSSMPGLHQISNAATLKSTLIQTQVFEVRGMIKNANGEPVEGATISSSTGTIVISKKDGSYNISTSETATLTISHVNYNTVTISVNKNSVLNITLTPNEKENLEEVVVTALGIKREERALGYATQKVDGEQLAKVKGTNVVSSLNGKVSGLRVNNTTEFWENSGIQLRGESALLVIDGVIASGVMSLQDIPADLIENIEVLKGPTAAALYGTRASGGAIMVTTKSGNTPKLTVNINSNTMFEAGFIRKPQVQKSYGRGLNGQLDTDYVWGPKLDIGDSAIQWNPHTFKNELLPLVSSGARNLENFMVSGMVTNNSVSIYQGNGIASFRAALNHVNQKGSFPNQHLNTYNANIGGELKSGDRFKIEANMGFTRKESPQVFSNGYNDQGYLYQLVMWTGPEYDIRDYRNYWAIPNEKQNWMYDNWYDNPYAIAYEKLFGRVEDKFNINFTINYKLAKDLNLAVRPSYNRYVMDYEKRNPTANFFSNRAGFDARGVFAQSKYTRWQTFNDAILTYKKKIGDFGLDAMAGGSIQYDEYDELSASTVGGLISPTFYSIKGSVEPASVGVDHSASMLNSMYGRLAFSWKNAIFLDGTGRNDWSSTQYKSSGAFFYPSLSSSIVLSEFINLPQAIDILKLRASWAQVKKQLGIYEDNRTFGTTTATWQNELGSFNSATYPSTLMGKNIKPSAERTWEIGVASYLFKKRLHLDFAFFNKLYYDRQISASVSQGSGFSTTLINYNEQIVRKGFEFTVDAGIVRTNDFDWNTQVNLASHHRYYKQMDSIYSTKSPYYGVGKRIDQYYGNMWQTTADGQLIHGPNGRPINSSGSGHFFGYTDPKLELGFTNSLRFKNFTANIAIDGRLGGVMYNYLYDKQFDAGTAPATDNQYRYDQVVNGLNNFIGNGVKVVSGKIVYDNWGRVVSDDRTFAPNDIQVGYQNYIRSYRGGDAGVQAKGFLKLREVALGYNIPKNLIQKTSLAAASIAITGQNLFIWSKFKNSDPDVNDEDLNSPSYRVIGINLNITF
ncbi:MAG: SusC/RagA family TonB-linked outer membrane protein [Bacteroidia bacterium]|nr:MAG: SusC/RagA family TonB-linked outer membrane protein [Bacteroidia bacterium]